MMKNYNSPFNNHYALFNWIGIGLTILSLGIATYLPSYSLMRACAFCTFIQYLLIALTVLYIWNLYRPFNYLAHTIQFVTALLGFLFSLRQVSFQRSFETLASCQTPKSSQLKAMMDWLGSGAPGCHTTATLGPLTLASWSLIVFFILCGLIGTQLYWIRNQSNK